MYGANFKNIVYGILLEKGIMYCLCKQNISKKNILCSLLFPLVWLGILPFIIAIIFKISFLLILAILNISGCIGDIIMFKFIARLDNDIEFSEYDEPTGFGLYSSKDLSSSKSWGLKYMGEQNILQRQDLKKFNISKFSIIILSALIMFFIIGCCL